MTALDWTGAQALEAVTIALVTGVIMGVFLGRWSRAAGQEAYTSREAYQAFSSLMLNARRPTSEWVNMGWWTAVPGQKQSDADGGCQFPDAADHLARRVLACLDLEDARSAANLKTIPPLKARPKRILDLGHGNGDSLLLIYQLLHPDALDGVTSLSAQAHRATERVGGRARVFCADAVAWLELRKGGQEAYDAIIAIDTAYHFPSRKRFFQAAFDRLAPGGKLVLFDLFAAYPYPPSDTSYFDPCQSLPIPEPPSCLRKVKHAVTLMLAKVSKKHLLSFELYASKLQEVGFVVTLADVTADVFPGFSSFLLSLGRDQEKFWRGGTTLEQFSLRMFGEVVNTWAQGGREGTVRGGLVCAVKPST